MRKGVHGQVIYNHKKCFTQYIDVCNDQMQQQNIKDEAMHACAFCRHDQARCSYINHVVVTACQMDLLDTLSTDALSQGDTNLH